MQELGKEVGCTMGLLAAWTKEEGSDCAWWGCGSVWRRSRERRIWGHDKGLWRTDGGRGGEKPRVRGLDNTARPSDYGRRKWWMLQG